MAHQVAMYVVARACRAEKHPSFKASTNARTLSSVQNTLNRSVGGLMQAVEKLSREVEVLRFDMASGRYTNNGSDEDGDVSRPWTTEETRPKTPMQEQAQSHQAGDYLVQKVHEEFRSLESQRPVSRGISPDDPTVGHLYRDFNSDPEGSSRPVSRAISRGNRSRPFTPAINEGTMPASRGDSTESISRPVSRQFLRHLAE